MAAKLTKGSIRPLPHKQQAKVRVRKSSNAAIAIVTLGELWMVTLAALRRGFRPSIVGRWRFLQIVTQGRSEAVKHVRTQRTLACKKLVEHRGSNTDPCGNFGQ